jgi:hypothetical protein
MTCVVLAEFIETAYGGVSSLSTAVTTTDINVEKAIVLSKFIVVCVLVAVNEPNFIISPLGNRVYLVVLSTVDGT